MENLKYSLKKETEDLKERLRSTEQNVEDLKKRQRRNEEQVEELKERHAHAEQNMVQQRRDQLALSKKVASKVEKDNVKYHNFG